MIDGLIELATQCITSPNNYENSQKFKNFVMDVANIDNVLKALPLSDNLILAYCGTMIRGIQNSQFCVIKQTKSEEGNFLKMIEGPTDAVRVYGNIAKGLAVCVLDSKRTQIIVRCCLELISACLKLIFEDSGNEAFINEFFPVFLNGITLSGEISSNQIDLINIEPRKGLQIDEKSEFAIIIIWGLMECLVDNTWNKPYYDHRKCIYIFRSTYLVIFLQFSIQFSKLLFYQWQHTKNDGLRTVMKQTIQCLSYLFQFPFTISYHEYDNQDDYSDNSGGFVSDIYFPLFYRHALCDTVFVEQIISYHHYLIQSASNFEEVRVQMHCLIRIINKFCVASHGSFKLDQEKQVSRTLALNIIQDLCYKHGFYDSYYLKPLIDVYIKFLGTSTDHYFGSSRKHMLDHIFYFANNVICNSKIILEDGGRNPFAQCFQILALSLDLSKGDEVIQENVKDAVQKIFQTALERIAGNESNQIINQFGKNNKSEVQCFSELFEHVPAVFQSRLQENLQLFKDLNPNMMSRGAQIVWLHLCSQLLPKNQADDIQVEIIIKYYQQSRLASDTISSLRYIKTLVSQILATISDGISTTNLWYKIFELLHQKFSDFILEIIRICINNFSIPIGEIIDESQQIFKIIYSALKKNDCKYFKELYQAVELVLKNINSTVFVNPKFYDKRRSFFSVIAIIWLNVDEYEQAYSINKLIKPSTLTIQSLEQYMQDISGLVLPIQYEDPYTVLMEITIQELKRLFGSLLANQVQIAQAFGEEKFIKSICGMFLAFLQDSFRRLNGNPHSSIPFELHRLFYPYFRQLATGKYELPQQVLTCLEKMIVLNPLEPLISIENLVTQLKTTKQGSHGSLVRGYFEHIGRVQDISWMFQLIEDNIEYMIYWWQQVMSRGLYPTINLHTIAESRIGANIRNKQNFARLVYSIGNYDSRYWDVSNFEGERTFVDAFVIQYQ